MRTAFPVLTALCLSLSLPAQEVQAALYRPSQAVLDLAYPPANSDERMPLKPMLHLGGKGFQGGKGRMEVRILAGSRELRREGFDVKLDGTVFERIVALPDPCAGADQVAWTWTGTAGAALKGVAPLRWSRFQGRVDMADGVGRPTYIQLLPRTFLEENFTVPVKADGSFDAQVPARAYAVVNVNSAGYAVETLERWAWNFDLTADRTEVFRMGRTELYGMHAFQMIGGAGTVFVGFRPTALSRVLQHRAPAAKGPRDEVTMNTVMEHLKIDAMAIAPGLTKADVKVWLDGEPQVVTDLARTVETAPGGFNQTLYLVQFLPSRRVTRGVPHEVKVEVESRDVLGGRLITDFGQGSVGFALD